jgi:mono/diheme cytochrome c family protein
MGIEHVTPKRGRHPHRIEGVDVVAVHTGATFRAAIVLLAALPIGAARADSMRPDGAAVFAARCARCHGAEGRSDTPQARALKVRPLVSDRQLARMTPAEVARAIRTDANHASMEVTEALADDECRAVAEFVKQLAHGQ